MRNEEEVIAVLSRLMSINPIGLVLLVLGVIVMLCGKVIPEKFKLTGKIAALVLAFAGAILIFIGK